MRSRPVPPGTLAPVAALAAHMPLVAARAAPMALVAALALPLAPASAQQEQTLADIRQQLSVLQVEMRELQGQLNTTRAPGIGAGGATTIDRVNAIETELQRLTRATEQLQFRIEGVSRDGAARIEDLRFQLCELTPECDLGSLPDPGPLGGTADGGASAGGTAPNPVEAPPAEAPPGGPSAGVELAVGERAEFDAARAALDSGDHATAAEGFGRFVATYPTGPLTAEAHYLRGSALALDNRHADAARSFLEAFSGTPEGPQAPGALVGLGTALGSLGQTDEACLTLSEVAARFPQSPAVAEARSAQADLGCAG